ncbi:hypothetical protein GGP89_001177 [Salinibacter ruber]|uniref:Uncharacterized protein n=1 Tax=Salinibacter ruber TaxID=146919 RepID=A0A9X2U1Z2_9BACT|nr:hypothetical protein [Salinibacter ruber]MCS3864629.1 hypothetical protein [Salinibacter ruber]
MLDGLHLDRPFEHAVLQNPQDARVNRAGQLTVFVTLLLCHTANL